MEQYVKDSRQVYHNHLKEHGCNLEIRAFTKQHGKEVCRWHYEGEYAVYNLPSWELAKELGYDITNPEKLEQEYYAVYLKKTFIGYYRLIRQGDWVIGGVGMKPEYCGKGNGRGFAKAMVELADMQHPGSKLRLMVRTFNKRAIRCYQKIGFLPKEVAEKQILGKRVCFLVMEFYREE